ncbi:Terpenoid synthase [Cordyceps militaris]|uniref:Terpenoid synthase n=1 Tax=Cordyceps militaris TaxID=73501 RepID=A0A2H4SM69_CORMI|nr:Terpenoid synthase [Cordyceps militaris]
MLQKKTQHPHYVDSTVLFKHEQSESTLVVLSEWSAVEKHSHPGSDTFALYFPESMNLQYDNELEYQLAKDIRKWPFFPLLPRKFQQLAVHLSHLCSYKADLSYERRVLLHHHVAWIFLMDDVTEMMPLYGLHDTAGKLYLDNLRNIIVGGQLHDMTQFKDKCPVTLIDAALLAQQILAEDLMPLKRQLLSRQHVKLCSDLLVQFFEYEYDEGKKFCTEASSQEVLQTRAITVGGLIPMALTMTSKQAEQCALNNSEMIQASVLMILINDIIGLYKDLKAVEQQNDGSAYLNLVRVGIREQKLTEQDALRLYIDKLNRLTWSVEFYQLAYPSSRQGLQRECLRLAFNYLDYHLYGIMGKPNNRYGWKHKS